jgi:hypothetical protein
MTTILRTIHATGMSLMYNPSGLNWRIVGDVRNVQAAFNAYRKAPKLAP